MQPCSMKSPHTQHQQVLSPPEGSQGGLLPASCHSTSCVSSPTKIQPSPSAPTLVGMRPSNTRHFSVRSVAAFLHSNISLPHTDSHQHDTWRPFLRVRAPTKSTECEKHGTEESAERTPVYTESRNTQARNWWITHGLFFPFVTMGTWQDVLTVLSLRGPGFFSSVLSTHFTDSGGDLYNSCVSQVTAVALQQQAQRPLLWTQAPAPTTQRLSRSGNPGAF